jgi:AhpD family alkylhydroperoxidase
MTLIALSLGEVGTLLDGGLMEHIDDLREELRGPAKALREEIPEVMRAFGGLSAAAMVEGDLNVATKELIALAIAITRECDGCVAAHARGAARAGATRRQVAEMAGVAILMNGGPGTVWGPRALAAFDQALAERES